ncbi:MAG: TlpA disulfide reductase family protein [Pirellulaceae bacterium]|nr:TlpA disulfide reductase family protein [Pirellulaceae bacterium]
MPKLDWMLVVLLLIFVGCNSESTTKLDDRKSGSSELNRDASVSNALVSNVPSQLSNEVASSNQDLAAVKQPSSSIDLPTVVPSVETPFPALILSPDADAKQIIGFLASIDKAMQELLQNAAASRMTQEDAEKLARVLSDRKFEAAERLDIVSDIRLHKELSLLAKLEALSHAAGLGDPKSAAQLRELASQSSNIESKLVAHQASIVLLGFELSDLAAGLTDAVPVLNQLDVVLSDPPTLKLPDFHVCAQTLKVLQQHGLDEAYEKAKEKTVAAFSVHADPQLAMRLWYLEVGSTPEFTALNSAMNDSTISISDFQAALKAVEDLSETQWTIGYLMQNLTNIEFSGQLEKVGVISELIEKRLDWIKTPDLKDDALKLIDGFKKRIATIGQPFTMAGLSRIPNEEAFDLDALKGKVVVVDFWASWCGPCRAEFPNLRELYGKYRDQGFEIVGVNLDERLEDMSDFLASESLPWIHVRATDTNLTGFKNPVAIDLGLTGIPFLMLIGRDGKTIAIHTRGLALANHLSELFK